MASQLPIRPERRALRSLSVVTDRKQPVLDGKAYALLNQGSRNAWNACPVGTLSDQLFEIGDGRKGQRDWNSVGFGFFCGHTKTLASKKDSEKYLLRVYLHHKGAACQPGIVGLRTGMVYEP